MIDINNFIASAFSKNNLKAICFLPKNADFSEIGDVDWLVERPKKALSILIDEISNSDYEIINIIFHATGIRLNLLGANNQIYPGPDLIWKTDNEPIFLSKIRKEFFNKKSKVKDMKHIEKKIILHTKLTRYLYKHQGNNKKLQDLLEIIINDYNFSKESIIDGYGIKFWLKISELLDHCKEKSIKLHQSKITDTSRHKLFDYEYFFWKAYSKFMKIINPSMASVVFLGPDGAGKSSVINGISPLFKRLCLKPKYYHLRPKFLNVNRSESSKEQLPHTKKNYGLTLSIIKSVYLALDYFLLIFFDYFNRVRGRVLIFDRYYYDLIVDPSRFRYSGPKKLSEFFLKFIWKPNLIILFVANPEIIHQRKPELSIDEIKRQLDSYEIFLNSKNIPYKIVRTDQSIDKSIDEAKIHFIRSISLLRKKNDNKRFKKFN